MCIYFYVQGKNVSKTNTKRQKQHHKNSKPIIVNKNIINILAFKNVELNQILPVFKQVILIFQLTQYRDMFKLT